LRSKIDRLALDGSLAEHQRLLLGPLPTARKVIMYLARFSYDVLPANRRKAVDFVRREVEAACGQDLNARLLIPLTRAQGGAALQFEVELVNLDQLEQFRQRGAGSAKETDDWMRAFSDVFLSPPLVEILRVDESQAP
jgi:hypothetical protein